MNQFDGPAPGGQAAMEEEDLGKLAEVVFQQVMESIPGVSVREAYEEEDAGVPGVEKPLAIDAVGALAERHAFVAQVTTSSMHEKQRKMLQHTLDMPYVPTRRLVDHTKYPQDPPMVPRMNIRLENGLMRQYAADRDISKHPELGAVVREQLLLNVAMHEKKMTTNEKGKPLPSAQLERVRASDAYRQLAELKDVFTAIEK